MPNDSLNKQIVKATELLKAGKIVAYPTEAVYGFGCNPYDKEAVLKLSAIKQRPSNKGYILIGESIQQVQKLIDLSLNYQWELINSLWPGPYTFVFRASHTAPSWVCHRESIALRVTKHPIAAKLVATLGHPITSTSANAANEEPLCEYEQVYEQFKHKVDFIIKGQVGDLARPTMILDAITGAKIRG